jgi:outer membrane protein TolC
MRYLRVFFVCFLTGGISVNLHGQAPQRFTLETALQRAPQANFDLLLSTEQVESAVQAQRRARAGLLPQIDAAAYQGRSKTRNTFYEDPDNPTFKISTFQALLRGRLSLFDVDTHSEYRVAKFNTEIARLELDQLAEDVRQAIAQLYFNHLRNLRAAEAVQAQIDRDQVLFDLAKRRLEAGSATQLDVARAEVRLASSELSLIQQVTQIYESETAFKRALDLDFERPIELAPVNLDSNVVPAFSFEQFEAVLRRRPEVVSEVERLKRNELAKRAADYQWVPSVEVSGDYGMEADRFNDDTTTVWSVQVGVSVPIFEGRRLSANQAEAASAVRAQTIALAAIEKEVEANYRLAIKQVGTAAQQTALAKRQVELATLELELSEHRFKEGVTDNSEVVEAQASLSSAEDGLVEAEFQYQLARLALARSEGDVLALTE